jgi:hypothetical protein
MLASAADAQPCKVVVLGFDGPRVQAELGHNKVVSLLSKYELVAPQVWTRARAVRTWSSWRDAAKRTGVNAVIEGWVQDEGRHHLLNVSVREATTGTEIDTVTVRVNDRGIVLDETMLATALDDVFAWVDCVDRTSAITDTWRVRSP